MSGHGKSHVEQLFKEVFEARDVDGFDNYLAQGFVEHNPFPGLPETAEGAKQSVKMIFDAFPDAKFSINLLFQEDDLVAIHSTFAGTHKGEFLGIPPTGKGIDIAGIDIVRVNDEGKALEHWGLFDTGTMMAQLGLMPEVGG